jgi:uncharacterized beta barrel domain-containing protein DUF5777
MIRSTFVFALILVTAFACFPVAAAAQGAAGAAPQVPDDPDRDFRISQPDFTVITLPTTLRLPRFKSAFRVTHRFGRPLGAGDFSDLVEDFFGLDSGAQIGLEYRFGLMSGLQAGIHRTSNKTIEFFGQYNVLQQNADRPVGLGAIASIEGTNNFKDSYTPSLGVVVSRELGRLGAVYFEPMWVNNTNPLPTELTDDNDTWIFPIAARIRLRPTVYFVAEIAPRIGFTPQANHGSFGIEKRAGGHVFQLNFSNGFGTTMGQVARGGTSNDDWYLGFNISRKFF